MPGDTRLTSTRAALRPRLDAQVTSSNGKDEKCAAGRGACVLLGVQRKGCKGGKEL